MASQFDESDFIDGDYQSGKNSLALSQQHPASGAGGMNRPLSREEIESKVSEAHVKLAELKRAQEELERERSALEEARRRRIELETGRGEMLQHLTRGLGVLEETEFNTRREAEQMSKTLGELREALAKVQAIREETWKPEEWQTELTRALTAIENARMEWNRARLKWPLLQEGQSKEGKHPAKPVSLWDSLTPGQWCKLGLALTWPLALIGLLGFGAIALILFR